jgi:hypothetical protein
MFVPDAVRQCVLFLGNKHEKTGKFQPRATAFVVCIQEGEFAFRFLVTAEHNISGFQKKGWDIWLRANTINGDAREEKLQGDWWFHPDAENNPTDVAVAPLYFQPDEEFKELFLRHDAAVPPLRPDIAPIAGTAEVLAYRKLGIGDEVFITGLFRSHYGRQRNVPIIRIGNIAMMRGEPVYTKYCGFTDAYLVEARSISGLSGSPVFVHAPPWQIIDGHPTVTVGGHFYLLGLMHGHFDVQNLNEDIVANNESDATGGINTGIGVVIPVEKILETIDHPELVQMRKDAAKRFRKQRGATPDFASEDAPPPTDENPKHREDFNSLLNAAVKKPAQED